MNETLATALITQARNLAAGHRYADAVKVLDTPEFREWAEVSQHQDLVVVLSEWAWWMAWGGRLRDGLAIYEELEPRLTPDIPAERQLAIRARHAYVVGTSGDRQTSVRAAEMLSAIQAEMQGEVDVPAQLRFHIRRQHARWLGTAGDAEQALELLRILEADMEGEIAEDSEEWLLLKSNLAYFVASKEPETPQATAEALERYEALVQARSSALGAMHPHTLDARRNAAWVLGRLDPAVALMNLRAMVIAAREVLSGDHRYIVTARLDIAVLASRLDTADVVESEVAQILASFRRTESAIDVLSEYGRVDTPEAKLDEVIAYLEGRGRVDLALDLRDLRAALRSGC